MYAISAHVVTRADGDGWRATRQMPTFYLDESVQGIVSEDHARRIAKHILDPYGMYEELHVTAVKL